MTKIQTNRKKISKMILPVALLLLMLCVAFTMLFSQGAASTAYANETNYEFERIPVTSVQLTADTTYIMPSRGVSLGVALTPHFAIRTAQSITYEIVQGAHLAVLTEDNKLVANAEVSIGASVVLVAHVDGVRSDEVVFTIAPVPVYSVAITNAQHFIYQNSSLALATAVYPADSTNTSLLFTIIDGYDYATISGEGRITVRDIPVDGRTIKVRIASIDNPLAIYERVFELRPSSAAAIFIDRIQRPNGTSATSTNRVRPNEVLTVDVSFPSNVAESMRIFELQLHAGNVAFASITHTNQITIVAAHLITNRNPSITVRAVHTLDPTVYDEFIFQIYVPVSTLTLTRLVAEVTQGTTIPLSSVVSHALTPSFTTTTAVAFEVMPNTTYAFIDGNHLVIRSKNIIRRGNATIHLQATSGGVVSNQIAINIFVAATTVQLSFSNTNPISRVTGSDSVTVTATPRTRLSDGTYIAPSRNNPTLRISAGAQRTALTTANTYNLTHNTFIIRNNLASGGLVSVTASQDGVTTAPISLTVYIPADAAFIANNAAVQRNVSTPIHINFPRTVSNNQWEWLRYSVTFPSNAGRTNLTNRTVNANNAVLRISGTNITIAQNTPAGTIVRLYYRSLGRINATHTAIFTVAPLAFNAQVTESFAGSTSTSSQFRLVYANDSSGVSISRNHRQLHTGRTTTVTIQYNNMALSNFGITSVSVARTGVANATIDNVSVAGFRINFTNVTNGRNQRVNYTVTIVDGTASYVLPQRYLYVFRPISANAMPSLTNTIIRQQHTTLNATGVGANYTATNADIRFQLVSGIGFSSPQGALVDNRLSMVSSTATNVNVTNPVVRPFIHQQYNNTTINFYRQTTIAMVVERTTLNHQGGTNSIANVPRMDSVNQNISIPTRRGFVFRGYWNTSAATGGTMYYNANGARQRSFQDTTPLPTSTLWARWTAITYTISVFTMTYRFHHVRNVHATFGSSQTIMAPSISGWTFSHWLILGTGITFAGSTITTATIEANHLPSNGGSFLLDAIYTENPPDSGCVVEGTLITLANGEQVAVENLTGNETLLTWCFHSGQFAESSIFFIATGARTYREVVYLQFENNSYIKMVYQHSFFNLSLNRFVDIHAGNALYFVGHFFKQYTTDSNGNLNWTAVMLNNVNFYYDYVKVFAPVTHRHFVKYANGFLAGPSDHLPFLNVFTVNRETLAFCQDERNTLIETFGLLDFETFSAMVPQVPEFFFYAYRGEYIALKIGAGIMDLDFLFFLLEKYAELLNSIF